MKITTPLNVVLLGAALVCQAQQPQLDGVIFRPGEVPIQCSATTDRKALWVYKIVPQTSFSTAVLSNAMTVGSFKPSDVVRDDKTIIRFQDRKRSESRYLDISASSGWIEYYDSTGIDMQGTLEGVPDFSEVERLGINLLVMLGIDRTQIMPPPRLKSDTKRSKLASGGKETNIEVVTRSMSFVRQVDGIAFNGFGGLDVEFGNHAKITQFRLVWRNLVPYALRAVAKGDELIEFMKTGKAVYAGEVKLQGAKKFTIRSLIPKYRGERAESPQEFICPMASLSVEAEFETNKLNFEVACPILSEHKPSR